MQEWIYRRLLRLLPPESRADAEPELLDIFRARLARARAEGVGAVVRLWGAAFVDVIRTAIGDRRAAPTDFITQGDRFMPLRRTVRDIALALRNVLRAPTAPALAILTLALGLAASLVAFVLVRDVLMRPLPFQQPERIVRLIEISNDGRGFWPSYPNCADWRTTFRPVFDELGCAGPNRPAPVIVGGRAVKATVAPASRGLFDALGVQPSIGRLFADDESRRHGAPAALVSASFWRNVLDAQPLGALAITVGDAVSPVVGVLPDDFAFLGDGGAWSRADVWTPLEREPNLGGRTSHGYHTVARLRNGVTLEQARAEMPRLSDTLKAEHHQATNADSVSLRSLTDVVTAPAREPLTVLVWAAATVLLVACLNFSATVLARGLGQQRFLRLRLALGASRADLIRLVLAESLALAIPAVMIGIGLATIAIRWLAASSGGALPRVDTLSLDANAALAAVATAFVCALLAGLAPAVALSARALTGGLEGRGAVGPSRATGRVWGAVVAAQMALTLVLLVATGLLGRSLIEAADVDLGYRTEGVAVVELTMPASRYADRDRRIALVRAVVDAVRNVPGVESVGVSSQLPTVTSAMMSDTRIDGRTDAAVMSALRLVDDGYFQTLGIPLRSRIADLRAGAAYVDETVASRLWKYDSPVGAALHHGAADGVLRVDGVAGAVREWDQGTEPYGTVYASWVDQPDLPLTMYVYARGTRADRHQIEVAAARIDPLVPAIATALATATAEPLRGRRLLVIVAIVLAAIACTLAFGGTYAIVMHTVRQRLREAAIRLALGATTANVRASFMRTGLVPAGAGLIVGIAGLKPAESLVSAQLFHVRPGDPLVLAAAVAALAIAAGLAVLLPTRRATHVNPTVLLRDE